MSTDPKLNEKKTNFIVTGVEKETYESVLLLKIILENTKAENYFQPLLKTLFERFHLFECSISTNLTSLNRHPDQFPTYLFNVISVSKALIPILRLCKVIKADRTFKIL